MRSILHVILFFITVSIARVIPVKRKAQFDTLISFGDSYSDNGSLDSFYKQDGHTNVLNSAANNGNVTSQLHRWSNGPVLVEHLASLLQSSLYDFSRSGATTNNAIYARSTQDVNTQTMLYTQSNIANNSKDATLYTFWVGVNDMHDLFLKKAQNYAEKLSIMEKGLDTLDACMHKIYDNGAKHMSILGLVPLTEVRLFETLNDTGRSELQSIVNDYNKRVKERVDKFNRDTNQSTAFFFDIYNTYYKLFSHVNPPITACDGRIDCGNYIWWDDLHPTTGTHSKLAKELYDSL